eukprot:5013518-Amphidinium_carterae.1
MFGELVATWSLLPKDGQPATEPRGTLGKLLQINYFGGGKTWILTNAMALLQASSQFVWMPIHIAGNKIGIDFPSGVKPAPRS